MVANAAHAQSHRSAAHANRSAIKNSPKPSPHHTIYHFFPFSSQKKFTMKCR